MIDNNPKQMVRQVGASFISGAFAVALALLMVLVLRSISVQITPPPGPITEIYPDTSTKELCQKAGGRWIPDSVGRSVENGPAAKGPYCQGPLAFERERQAQEERSQQTSLFVFAVGGAIAAALSLLAKILKPIAPGLMIGAIVSFFIAGTQIWMMSPGLGRLITIVVIFLILAGIGVYMFGENQHRVAK